MATKTDAEKRAEAEAKSKDKSGETDSERLGKVDLTQPHSTDPTDPGSQENFGLPDGVSTKASRGEVEGQDGEPVSTEGEPNPTVEEQLGTDTDEDEDLKEG
jgi:hypothetical protein